MKIKLALFLIAIYSFLFTYTTLILAVTPPPTPILSKGLQCWYAEKKNSTGKWGIFIGICDQTKNLECRPGPPSSQPSPRSFATCLEKLPTRSVLKKDDICFIEGLPTWGDCEGNNLGCIVPPDRSYGTCQPSTATVYPSLTKPPTQQPTAKPSQALPKTQTSDTKGFSITDSFGFGNISSLAQGVGYLTIPAFSLATLAVIIYFLIGAIKFLTSSGNKDAVSSAQNMITHAIIGFILLILLFLIMKFIPEFFGINLFLIG